MATPAQPPAAAGGRRHCAPVHRRASRPGRLLCRRRIQWRSGHAGLNERMVHDHVTHDGVAQMRTTMPLATALLLMSAGPALAQTGSISGTVGLQGPAPAAKMLTVT